MRVLFFIAFLLVNSGVYAQYAPVQWTFSAEAVNDTEYDLVFTADIDRGWSVYSQHLGEGQGPVPTSFEFPTNPQFELVGETLEMGNKHEIFDEMFGMNLTKYWGKARFVQRVKVNDGTHSVVGQLTYMTCDESSCLPPEDVKFEIVLH